MNVQLFPDEQQLCAAKILIVDDEEADIRVLQWTLRVAKFANVRSLTDPTRTLEIFQQFQPDLLLLDLFMPKLDGFAILKQLRETMRTGDFLPVLVLTGFDTAETRSQAMAAGASDFLGKPLDCTEVMLRIRNLLQTRFLHQRALEMQKQLEARPAVRETSPPTSTGRKP
ncbi:MAG TPA: response regulator [Verrucomicrobiae bacterium]|nr:response regulator [Verrucomicrobiae bacterium]